MDEVVPPQEVAVTVAGKAAAELAALEQWVPHSQQMVDYEVLGREIPSWAAQPRR